MNSSSVTSQVDGDGEHTTKSTESLIDKRPRSRAVGYILGGGAILTLVYIAWVVGTYTFLSSPGEFFEDQKFNVIGDFFSGICAPLALIWLIVAVLMQRQDLKESKDQFAQSQDVVAKQMDFISQQNQLMQEQHKSADESAKRSYRLSLFDQRFRIYNDLRGIADGFQQDGLTYKMRMDMKALQHRAAFIYPYYIDQWLSGINQSLDEYAKSSIARDNLSPIRLGGSEEENEIKRAAIKANNDELLHFHSLVNKQLAYDNINNIFFSSLRVSDDD